MNLIVNLDIFLTNLINNLFPHNQIFDYFFSFFSLQGNSIFIWLALIIFALLLEERKNPGIQKRDILFVTTFLLCFLVTAFLINIILKNTFHRPRPSPYNAPNTTAPVKFGLAQCPNDYSFPSGHASTAFASAVVISTFDKKRKWFYYLFAVLISLSRIYLGCHYFLDVVAGGIIGWSINKGIIFQLSKTLRGRL